MKCPVQDLLLDLERLELPGNLRALATPLTKRLVRIPLGVEPVAAGSRVALLAIGCAEGGRDVGGRSALTSGPLYGTPLWAVTGTFRDSRDPSKSREQILSPKILARNRRPIQQSSSKVSAKLS